LELRVDQGKGFASRIGEKAISADSGIPNAPSAPDSACTGVQKHGLSKQNVIPGHQILKTRMLTLPQKQPAMVLKNFAFLVKNLLFRSPTKKKKD
jgi:hypothetical protein